MAKESSCSLGGKAAWFVVWRTPCRAYGSAVAGAASMTRTLKASLVSVTRFSYLRRFTSA